MDDLRIAATELLPLDADRREDALVHLAFMAQAAVVPALADAAEGAAQRLQEPLAARIAHAVQAASCRRTLTLSMRRRAFGCYSTGCASSSLPLPGRPRPGGRWGYWMTTSPRWPSCQPPPGAIDDLRYVGWGVCE